MMLLHVYAGNHTEVRLLLRCAMVQTINRLHRRRTG